MICSWHRMRASRHSQGMCEPTRCVRARHRAAAMAPGSRVLAICSFCALALFAVANIPTLGFFAQTSLQVARVTHNNMPSKPLQLPQIPLSSSPPPPAAVLPPPAAALLLTSSSCPRIFVYNRSELDSRKDWLFHAGYGKPMHLANTSASMVRNTRQHSLGAILLYRLLTSPRCTTDRPEEADLFVIPMLITAYAAGGAEESNKVWSKQAPSIDRTLWPVCRRMLYENWSATLPHLTPRTARRHIFINPEFLQLLGFCTNIERFTAAFDSSPNLPLIRKVSHLGNSFTGGSDIVTYSLIYPSCVHLTASELPAAPWRPGAFRRNVLMMYGGSTYGSPFAVKLREHLVRECKAYGGAKCALVTSDLMERGGNLNTAYELKTRAVFCLEPPGFGVERKAMVDALHLGCIPVLFMPRTDSSLWPYHWSAAFKPETRVMLDGEKVLRGAVNVLRELEAISPPRIAAMQQAIADHAHQMHYAVDDAPGDAFDTAFRAVLEGARERECRQDGRGCSPHTSAAEDGGGRRLRVVSLRHSVEDNHRGESDRTHMVRTAALAGKPL